MKLSVCVFLFVFLSACASADLNESPQNVRQDQDTAKQTESPSSFDDLHLENHGLAPELTNQVWLNTDHPLRLADLRGKVVLLDMWTFG